MPLAVTHFLVPAICCSLYRDLFVKKRFRFVLHYDLIAGLAGILPDFDFVILYLLGLLGFSVAGIHRTFTHTLLFVLVFVILGIMFVGTRNRELGRHRLKLSGIFFVIAFGVLMHLVLDAVIIGSIMPLYPFLYYSIGVNLAGRLPEVIQSSSMPALDAVLLFCWMIILEVRHKISDYI
jgi:membrane-bound metal-dependent hydrolase YbcI (DUF457 family)